MSRSKRIEGFRNRPQGVQRPPTGGLHRACLAAGTAGPATTGRSWGKSQKEGIGLRLDPLDSRATASYALAASSAVSKVPNHTLFSSRDP
ncbi:hypothetical protein HPP92_000839 [Vanilla planifolia]|uniref:Uncharacterized protein n=1 Tax=Vanilla planifolia TaxID=51239 RepID=A0A835VGD5_VANPL|nr:hypothetical protein HPP92_000839 [Vanilla planifolia]